MANFAFKILVDDQGAGDEEMASMAVACIEAAAIINLMWFQSHPDDICALACGKVKYDAKNKEVLSKIADIKTAPRLISSGIGLCIDIVAFDVAARRFEGFNAWPAILPRGGGIFHVVTQTYNLNGEPVTIDPAQEMENLGYAVHGQPKSCGACR